MKLLRVAALLCTALFAAHAGAQTYTTMYPPLGGPYKYTSVSLIQSGNVYNPNLGSQAALGAAYGAF